VKEHFTLAASQEILSAIDAAAGKAGVSRGQAFDDFLTFVRCSLAGGTMEAEYLAAVRKGYDQGTPGARGIDLVARTFGKLVLAMEETGQDVLGDIFTGGITYGEKGQFFTPDPVCQLMAELTAPDEADTGRKSVNDPACGSGRTLLAVARKHPTWEFVGQDVDHRCAQMTAINLGLNGLRGWAVWQNSLTLQCHRAYRIGLNLITGGVIREVAVEESPFGHAALTAAVSAARPPTVDGPTADPAPTQESDEACPSFSQLDLF
jgi:hypothetical protein